MTRSRAVPAALLFTGLVVVAGCGSSDDTDQASASTSPSQAPVCASVDALQNSVDALRDADVSQQGVDALRTDLGQGQVDLQAVAADAKSEYATDVDRREVDVTAVQTAADAARATPSAATLVDVGTAVRVLAEDVRAFSGKVSETC